jgi:hypothetical protein
MHKTLSTNILLVTALSTRGSEYPHLTDEDIESQRSKIDQPGFQRGWTLDSQVWVPCLLHNHLSSVTQGWRKAPAPSENCL